MNSKINNNSAVRSQSKRWKRIGAAVLLASFAFVSAAAGDAPTTAPGNNNAQLIADGMIAHGATSTGLLQLMVGKSSVLTTRVPVKRVNVASPDVADVNPIGPQSVLVTAKKAGSTQVIVWDDNDRSQVIDVDVAINLKDLEGQFKKLIPDSQIDVSVSNGTLVLKGHVTSLETAKQAQEIAAPYSAKIVNLLEVSGGQQVTLQVRFAEVSRNATSQLGVNLGFTDGKSFGATNVGQVNPFTLKDLNGLSGFADTPPGAAVTAFGRGTIGNTALEGFVAALRQNNLLRTLAEPNLTTTSGQEATFLAGGEFPVPVPQTSGGAGSTITVEYKEFGVRMKFTPIVLGNGMIRLKVNPEVSDLDFSSPVSNGGFVMPVINKRSVTTVVELSEGQSFAVAGLLNNNVAATSDILPGLGDLPYLGSLFRSVRYQRKETELVVLVTPHLAAPMNPSEVPLLPGERWRHPTENELFWDRDLGGPMGAAATTQPVTVVANDAATTPADKATAANTPNNKATSASAAPATAPAPRFHGAYGFQPVADIKE